MPFPKDGWLVLFPQGVIPSRLELATVHCCISDEAGGRRVALG